MSGFVTFVSAGPGDPDLMTLKGARRLAEADVVLYDDLASGCIGGRTKSGARLVSVGKRAGRPSAKQHHVSRLLVDYANTGAQVVRLKSGDAGIFGRLEEEVVALRRAGVGFEIIPGVSAASAAAAITGIPLTRRLTARRIQFVTGADISGHLPSDLNWQALVDPQATTVVYMGKRTFSDLVAELVRRGLSPDTPAILAEGISRSDQRLVRSTIAGLAEAVAGEPATVPALILYGPLADG